MSAVNLNQQNVASTVALCSCSLMNAYLMISVFPYAGYMVIELKGEGMTQDNVGTYAGLLTSAFMIGRTLSALGWGKAGDVYGRTIVLKACLLLSMVFSLLFGLSTSLTCALVWRFCLGLSNGLISTAKTAATELAHGNQAAERRNMGLVIGMRSWGYLLSPAIGGLLADPVQQYPQSAAWLHQSFLHSLLTTYRFLLPNLVACVGCFIAFVVVTYFVHETLPTAKRRDTRHIPRDLVEWIRNKTCCSIDARGQTGETRHLLSSPQENVATAPPPSTFTVEPRISIWQNIVTRRHLVVHWVYSFVSMCADEMFPLFCMSQTGGLSLAEGSIGKILSGAGVLFAISQYTVFSTFIHYFGEYKCLLIASILGVQPTLLIPLSRYLNTATSSSSSVGVSWSVLGLLSVIMAVCKLFGMLYFASLALALNKTVPISERGTMNGLVVTGASLARSVAPTFAGALTTFSFSSMAFPSRYGSLLMYSTLSLLGMMVTFRVRKLQEIQRKHDNEEVVEMEVVEENRI